MTSNAGSAPASLGWGLALSLLVIPLLVLGVVTLVDRSPATAPEGRAVTVEVEGDHAGAAVAGSAPREALRRWDRLRVAAWTSSDPVALRRLYAPGSQAGARDVAMLRRWVDRGLRVREMRMQVSAIRPVRVTERRMVIEVTDRLAHAVAVGPRGSVTLPGDRESTRRITFRRAAGGAWRVAAVRPVV